MDAFLTSIFNIALFPFSSGTFLVVVPCLIVFFIAIFGLIRRII